MTRGILVGLCLMSGCGSNKIAQEFEVARTRAVADPGPAADGWAADGALHMSPALVDDLMKVGIETYGAMSGSKDVRGPLGVRGNVEYEMAIRRLDVSGTNRCERCVVVTTRVGGDVNYQFGPVRGTTPVTVDVEVDVRFDVTPGSDSSFEVFMVTQEVRDVQVSVRNLGGGIRGVVERELSAFGQEALLSRMQPISLGAFGGADFPIRALTVDGTEDGGATLQFLTRSPTPMPVGQTIPKLRDGWQLDVSQSSLLGFAAKTSFELGELSHGVVVEPTALRITTGSFEMDLRLWKPGGTGWWRDYTVSGGVELEGAEMSLSARSVEETGQSPGAVLADPLAAIGETFILKAIQDGVNQSLPLAHTSSTSGFVADLGVRTIAAGGDILTVRGNLNVRRTPPPATGPAPGMTRPAPGMTRPAPGMTRPAPGMTRPAPGMTRP
jgi:hypothetical protein